MISLPEKYLNEMKELLKEEFSEYLDSFDQKPFHGLRVNTSKIPVEDFLKIAPFPLSPIPWTDDGFYYREEDRPAKHPYYYAGLYYLQEPSAMYPAQVLPVEKGDRVLDACAAPGGKSLRIADRLDDEGLLISNDVSVSRSQVLLKNLESHGVKNAIVMVQDLKDLDRFRGYFDRILVDAPCSGEGMFRKDPSLINSWLEKGSRYYPPVQKKILSEAIELLRPGGKLVYSTCTFSKKENEEVIEHVLALHEDIRTLPVRKYEGFMSGLTERTKDCVRIFPHRVKGEGHFVALLEKQGTAKERIRSYSDEKIGLLEGLSIMKKDRELLKINDRYYLSNRTDIDLKGLRILRNGLYLGEMRHDRFQPSQALASALNPDEYGNILDFDLNDERVMKYLRCETLDVRDRCVKGCVLVCADGHPLGFGQVEKGILKNKYPANYRIR